MDKFTLLPYGFLVHDSTGMHPLYWIEDADLLTLSGYLDNAITVQRIAAQWESRAIILPRYEFARCERNLLDTLAVVGL